ncbi:SPOR domain-containing protein [Campylobacter fetus]|nr:SPOR domain-containing protein [Campylobacter fetus]
MEENNKGLQDILLDKNEDDKSSKIRKILISVAGLVILFVIVLIVMKLLNGGSPSTDTKEESLALPAEPELRVETNQPATTPNNEIFEQVPIISDTNSKDNFENIVNEYKNNQAAMNNNQTVAAALKAPESVVPAKDNTPKAETNKNITPKVPTQKKAEPSAKPAQKAAVTKPAKTGNLASGNYIQVASLSKVNSNDPFIKKIKENGFDYHAYETTVNGKNVVKILIGPYNGAELNTNMEKIRKNISSGAFLFKVQ